MIKHKLITQVFSITCLKETPEVLPFSTKVLTNVILFSSLWKVTEVLSQGIDPIWALSLAIIPMLMQGAFLYKLLEYLKKANRFVKIWLALQATSFLVNFLIYVAMLALPGLGPMLFMIGSIWLLAINAHIFRHGLEYALGKALLVAFGFTLAVQFASLLIFQLIHTYYPIELPTPPVG